MFLRKLLYIIYKRKENTKMEGKQYKNPSPPPSMLVRKYRKGNLIVSGVLLGSVTSICIFSLLY